jgi:oligopeptide transport system substrate-binding protein
VRTNSPLSRHKRLSPGLLRNVSIWILVGIGLLLLGCVDLYSRTETSPSPTSRLPAGPTEGVLRLAGSDPPTLDPALVEDAVSAGYVVEIFSGLVSLDPVSLEVVPDITESWEESDSRTEYTFHVRQDAKFHDGKPVTAWDFKYSLERACNPTTGSSTAGVHLGDIVGVGDVLTGEADEISGVRVLDDRTLEITVDGPKPYFLAKLTHPVAFVVDRENVAEGGRRWYENPNGTGPFRLERWEVESRLVLAADESHHGGAPELDQVVFILDAASPFTLYEQGKLDAVPVGVADIERVLDPNNPLNRQLSEVEVLATYYIGLNVSAQPFDDLQVRQAFHMAIDRDKLADVVYKKMAEPAKGILPPGFPGYDPELESLPYDPARARQLLADSRYGGAEGLPPIVLLVSGGGASPRRTVEAVYDMCLRNLGVELQIQQMKWSDYLGALKQEEREFQMFGVDTGWIADYPDPENFLDVLFHSGSNENDTGYASEQVDRLLGRARTERDPNNRLALYREVERILVKDSPWIPLTHDVEYWLTKPYVHGMIYAGMQVPHLKYVSVSR